MQIDSITPLILTFNEQDNLRETLAALTWAKQILIVDSGSSDDTLLIASEFPSVLLVQRKFDHFADQCNFGLSKVETPWVLSLDADYVCVEGLADELIHLDAHAEGYLAKFQYGIYGRVLRGSLYPPRTILYRKAKAYYVRDGHAHRVVVDGIVLKLRSTILHDDRKPLSHWFHSQFKYASLEADKLLSSDHRDLGWKDRIRLKIIFAPILTFVYCLLARGLILNGWAGFYYTMQRVFAELSLSLTLLDRKLKKCDSAVGRRQESQD